MAETWLDIAIPRPGPSSKVGYGPVERRELTEIAGEIKHSMVGSFLAAWGQMANMELNLDGSFVIAKSFTFSVLKDGTVFQHYPLEAIAWTAGSFGANLAYISEEHEGGGPNPADYSEPLTEPQYQATLRLTRAIRAVLPHLGPPSRLTNLKEHREMTALGSAPTACPSGRIPWARLIQDLEDTMTPEELLRRIEILEEADNNLRAQIHSMAQVLAVNGITLDFRLADSVRAIEVAIGEMLRTAEGQSAAWADIRRRWFREG